MKKRLLLFFPNTSNRGRITTAIPILGGIAKKRGWDVNYFDTSFYEKEDDSVIDREKTGGFRPGAKETIPDMQPKEKLIPNFQALIDDYKPDFLAITAMTCDYQYLMTFFPQIKIPNETKVIIGGLHAMFKENEVIESNMFDLICLGQGEATFNDILSRVETNTRIDNIPGTTYRDKKNKKTIHNEKRFLLPADKLWETEEEYSFFDKRYFSYPFDGKSINMFWADIGRGCPYACSYCGNAALKEYYQGLGRYIVSRPIDSVFKILKKVINEFNINIFNITHECFLAQSNSWLEEFAERWAQEIRKSFLIVTRAETVSEEKLAILKKTDAPIIQVGLGVESGSPRILWDVCKRTVTNEQIIRAFKLLHKHNFRSNAYYMLGFPYETREDIFQTIDICRKIDADVDSVSIFQPLPGQLLTKICIKEGYINGNERIPSFTESSILKMPQISAKEISNLRRVFLLYGKLPKEYWPQIKKCEEDYESNKDLFEQLVKLRWKIANNKPKHQFRNPQFN